jgi:hypothetical protein
MNPSRMERECRAYARYLTGQEMDGYLAGKYAGCHATGRIAEPTEPFDCFLTDVSVRGPMWTRLADAYASRFRKDCVLRKKLVLTLALLECSPSTFEYLDGVSSGGRAGALVRMAGEGLLFAVALPLAILLFFPVQMWITVTER